MRIHAQLERRYVYLEGKRKTQGFQLFAYTKELLTSGFKISKKKPLLSAQMQRREFYLNNCLGVVPDYFNIFRISATPRP
jgi:hypothetical protein